MTKVEQAIEILTRFKETGVKIAIDDFGTGYSSLSYLKQMPLDRLKIDSSFIVDLATNQNNRTIVDTVIKLGHSLDLAVVAEGVATASDAKALRQLGCDIGQGYYFSKPLPADTFLAFLSKHVLPVTKVAMPASPTHH